MRSSQFIRYFLTPAWAILLNPAWAQSGDFGPRLLEKSNHNRRPIAAADQESGNLKINVNMTLVPVTVLDSMGRSVTGLTTHNFRIFDNSKPVNIASFARQDQPIAVGLVFDCSRSMLDKYRNEREAPRQLFEQLGKDDESFLITVSDRAELRSPLSTEFTYITDSLLFTHPNGTTPLLDGVYMGLAELKHSKLAHKALIVVSDGGDNNSRYTLHQIDQIAAESDAQIFTILLYNSPKAPEELLGPELLDHLAGKTGGVNFLIQKMEDIHDAMTKIGINLHNQYVLGYYVPDDGRRGQYRKIAVQLLVPAGTPRLQIHARPGYYTP